MSSIIPKNTNINKFIEEFNLKNGNKKNQIIQKIEQDSASSSDHKSCALCEACSYNKNYKSIMKLHGSKIWFTMHLIVESIPPEKEMTIKECATIWITLYTIINALPCNKCTTTSLKWLQGIAPPEHSPINREEWMKELWKHHNDVNKALWLENTISSSETRGAYPWKKYLKDVDEHHMTCGKMEKDDYLFGKIDDYNPIFMKKKENDLESKIKEDPEVTMKNVMRLL